MSLKFNQKGGKNYKKKSRRPAHVDSDVVLDIDNGEGFYGTVLKLCGQNRLNVKLHNGETVQAIIPGRMYKKVWIKIGYIVLVSVDCEIIKVIKATDKESRDANNMIQKTTDVDDIFGNMNDESDDENVNQSVSLKNKELAVRKEKNKQRDLLHKQDRQFTDQTILEADTVELNEGNSNKKDDSLNQTTSDTKKSQKTVTFGNVDEDIIDIMCI